MTQYDLFLSYNSADRREVETILTELEKLPDQFKLNTFIDRERLTLGKRWFEEIEEALRKSRAVAVFYGKNGLGRWQNLEMILAIDLQATAKPNDGQVLVIPVILPGADLERAPRFLLLNNYCDLRSPGSWQNLEKLAQTVLHQNLSPQRFLDSLPLHDGLRNPYRGLDYFREEDAPLFFGRDDIALKLLDKVKTCALVALVGNSGTGKSSVVRAGLMPLLRKQHAPDPSWEVIVFNPGGNPFQNLSSALLKSWNYGPAEIFNKNPETEKTLRTTLSLTVAIAQTLEKSRHADKLLLVIDQFEEVVTQEKTGRETAQSDFALFVELLLSAIQNSRCHVLLTIRGDYYGTVTERHLRLAGIIEKGTVTLSRLEDAQLRDIIEKPARLGGGKLQDGLADRILDDVAKQPGNLALLEFALTSLWNHQRDGLLTHEAYENKIGKLEGAISKKADEILNSPAVGDPQLALAALTRLVRVTSSQEEGGDTRQRVALNEFSPAERACLEPFVKARLLVASGSWHASDGQALQPNAKNNSSQGSTVEVAHEALIRHWPKLLEALKDKRELLIWRQTIRPQYEEWQPRYKSLGDREALNHLLLKGFPLTRGLKWLNERPADLMGNEPEFIRLSKALEDKRDLLIWRDNVRPQFEEWLAFHQTGGHSKRLTVCLLQGHLLEQGLKLQRERWRDLTGYEHMFLLQSWEKTMQWQKRLRLLKKGGVAAAVLALLAFAVQIWVWMQDNEPSWSLIARAVGVRVAVRIPGLMPAWLPQMKRIEPRLFRMGSTDEVPPHTVTIKKPFYLGVYEVKFSDYERFIDDLRGSKYRCPGPVPVIDDSGWGLGERPAINISWNDAQCYTKWLSFLTGSTYRLPTEAEWEYAARADTSTDYYWGQNDPKDFAWFFKNSENKPHPVGERKPNAFGLHDMAGNVYEWVQDCWHRNYLNAPDDGTAWESQDKDDCTQRVFRGGSWNNWPVGLRSAGRYRLNPDNRNNTLGFRLAKDCSFVLYPSTLCF
jgi:formylglycine-generating enzyme required for sulfatase activity